ncbi:50S ribosomal protein L25 [candidate division WWE3 bacterium CG08_land_8_20_14_0_20_41_10]|uniref:50S ribosomal protein L25 n=1 Tax=candidate division WWE3 bacterium CG08_land_8_20_14_0_20_41_10 TaxID=1975085 RepID=A0A2H0XCP2_UNCKA|nr:MAG: 50S ribosomal protein L25 [candidate division WWE3 bacterium CG08_land_8_20_14_0_20_41_10]
MQINAKTRSEFGKHNKPLRKQNSLPGVVMEKAKPSLPVTLGFVEFSKVYKDAGETALIDFALEGINFKVLISEVQLNPMSLKPIHAVFRKVDLKEKLTAQIPVEIVNEELNPLIKAGEAILLKLLSEITVEALPSDLPKEFIIDAVKLINIGDEIKVADLEYNRAKVEISEYNANEPVAKLDKVEEMKIEEEIAPALTEEEALAKVTATAELSDEEKAKREEEKKAEKGEKDKAKSDKK